MPQIEVEKPFTLTLDDGAQKQYLPGKYEVDEKVAHHWFALPHLKKEDTGKPEKPKPQHPHEGDTSPAGLVAEKTIDQTAAPDPPAEASVGNPDVDLTANPILGVDEPLSTVSKSKKGL